MKPCLLTKTSTFSLMLVSLMAIGSTALAQEAPKSEAAHDMDAMKEAGAAAAKEAGATAKEAGAAAKNAGSAVKNAGGAVKDAMTSSLNVKDAAFVRKAGGGNLAEVKLGELAQSKSENADVKSFGQMMVTDHGKANDDLKAVATKKGMTFEPKLNPKQEATSEKLGKLSGAAFDRAYITDMLKDHNDDVAEYKMAVSSLKDEDLKAYATATLTVIEHHLEMVKEMKAKEGNSMEKKK